MSLVSITFICNYYCCMTDAIIHAIICTFRRENPWFYRFLDPCLLTFDFVELAACFSTAGEGGKQDGGESS